MSGTIEQHHEQHRGTGHRPEILIVEDNFLTASELSDIVRDCGYGVAGTVARVNRGLELLDQKPVDGAIIDINLDGTYSFPLCAELERRHVPYCFLTGYPTSIIPPDFSRTRLLTKPADRDQIRLALTSLLKERAERPELRPQPMVERGFDRGNAMLQGLDAASWTAIQPHLEHVRLGIGDVLEEAGHRPAWFHFPITAAVSLEAGVAKQRMQVALVGREGMVGACLLLGGVAANRAVVQFEGASWRVPADALADCLEQHRDLHRALLRGVNAFIARVSLTALANGQGTIEQRLARWLLTAADRLDTDALAITHDTLSQVLGVRRAGVTVALHMLEGKHAVRSARRRVRILDRDRLTLAAGPYRPQKI
ncbi:MAG: helix-turn-helix domain-containing protein [Proteobacteria bacterium]|nr:helix-turn-helix domain-containing protein [Pseudomonadota bacterium]